MLRKVLFMASVWPEPTSSAAGKRSLDLLRLLREQGYRVICASAAAESPHAADLGALGIVRQTIVLNSTSFDDYVKELQPDAVFFDRFMTEEQFGWRVAAHCPQALRVLDTIDLHFLRQAREKDVAEILASGANLLGGAASLGGDAGSEPCATHSPFKTHASREGLVFPSHWQTPLAMREIASILRCDLSLLLSEAEMEGLRSELRIDPEILHYYPMTAEAENAMDAAHEPEKFDFAQRNGYVTIGNFRHAPNWDAVLQLKRVIWPRIRRNSPQAELRIYGAYAPPKAFALHAPKEGFLVLGRADSVAQVMKEARVCLAPLRFGAGVKGKLLDAMVHGLPSVTTSLGAEGMYGGLPWGGAIEDEPEAFAASAIALHENKDAWSQAQENGRAILKVRYAPAPHHAALLARLSELRQDLAAHRHRHFLGTLLQYHTLQSTKYMARWIEEKNRRPKESGQPRNTQG